MEVKAQNIFIPYQEAPAILASHASEFPEETRSLEHSIGAYLAEDLNARVLMRVGQGF